MLADGASLEKPQPKTHGLPMKIQVVPFKYWQRACFAVSSASAADNSLPPYSNWSSQAIAAAVLSKTW